jgi:hypothetical protein
MRTIFLLFISLFLIQTNCRSQSEYPNKRDKQDYKEILSLYPKDFVSHLPQSIANRKIGFFELEFPRGRYLSYIHLALPYEGKKIEQLKSEAASKAKKNYHFSDSCLIIPYDYKESKMIKSDSISNTFVNEILPIPNFHSWECNFDPIFYKEAIIYLLDAKEGRFLADDCLSKSGVGLPKKWIHGYTKGLTFYKSYVLYWLEVW